MIGEWNVYTKGRFIGTVIEVDEGNARCAALHKFGVSEEDVIEAKGQRENFGDHCILPNADFSVSRR